MPPWIRLMTRADVERAVELARGHTLDEIMAMAVDRHAKDRRNNQWVFLSCVVGLSAAMYLLSGFALDLKTHPAVWCVGILASMLLPLPALAYGSAGHKEGRIIALAYYLRKDPRFPANRK